MSRKPTGRPNGRPRTEIDWPKFEFGCQIMATKEEICHWLKVSESTLERHIKGKYGDTFEGVFKRLSADGKISLRRMQFKKAQEGNVPMLIWMGKQYLGQSEKQELSSPTDKPLEIKESFNVSSKVLTEALGHLLNAGAIRVGGPEQP